MWIELIDERIKRVLGGGPLPGSTMVQCNIEMTQEREILLAFPVQMNDNFVHGDCMSRCPDWLNVETIMGKRVKVPQTYVSAKVVHADDLNKCSTFEPQTGARVRGEQATMPLNKVIRLTESVKMGFFGGGSVTLEGRVCLRAYGSPSSFGTVELLDVPA